jgi:hypothetical protein
MKVAYVAAGAEAYAPFSRIPSNIGGSVRVLTRPFFRIFVPMLDCARKKYFYCCQRGGRNAIAGMRGCSAPEGGVRGQYYTISRGPALTLSPTFASC